MLVTIEPQEATAIMESYVRRTFELTPEYEVKVTKRSYEDNFNVKITRPESTNNEEQ